MNIIKTSIYLIAALFSLSFSTNSFSASSFSCTGTIDEVGVHGTDRVMLKLSSMAGIAQICNVSQNLGSMYTISPEQCKLAYSTLLAAYAMDKTINVFFDNVEVGTSCGTLQDWEVATARWVHLSK